MLALVSLLLRVDSLVVHDAHLALIVVEVSAAATLALVELASRVGLGILPVSRSMLAPVASSISMLRSRHAPRLTPGSDISHLFQ